MSKILIAYFSRKGENYLNGKIVNLNIGNTEVVAKKIQELTGGDLFRIETVQLYPADYNTTTKIALEEKRNHARPELKETVKNINFYDTVYLGYPNWWGTFPMAVFTFLESYDFSGKTIAPFCTHEGSGLGSSERDIRKLCPGAGILPGLAIRGGSVHETETLLKAWINSH